MSKPKKRYIEGKNYFLWDYEPQTQMKHQVVFDYFRIWASKLGKFHSLCFFDCNGGSGAYLLKNEIRFGSSIEIGKIALNMRESLNRCIYVLVCEKELCIYNNLKCVINDEKLSETIRAKNINYEEVILQNKSNFFNKYPTLFFVDPFGFDFKMDILKKMLSFNKCEVILNFMYSYIHRFIGNKENEGILNAAFATEEWKKAIILKGIKRELFLVELLKRQIKKISGAKFVIAYKLTFYDKSTTYYYLFHISNNYDGCSLMKSSFAKYNNGNVEYLGYRNNQLSIINLDEFKITDTKEFFLLRYKCREITFKNIAEDVIDNTMLLESDIRKALHSLEDEKAIVIKRVESKRNGIKGTDLIIFF